jgi:hypothetical protein
MRGFQAAGELCSGQCICRLTSKETPQATTRRNDTANRTLAEHQGARNTCNTGKPESHLDVSYGAGKRIDAVMNPAQSE